MQNSNNSNSNSNLSKEEFDLWKDHSVTQIVMQLLRDRQDDVFVMIKEAAIGGQIMTDIEQARCHEAIRFYEDFIDLDITDIEDFYDTETDDEVTTAGMGEGISQTG